MLLLIRGEPAARVLERDDVTASGLSNRRLDHHHAVTDPERVLHAARRDLIHREHEHAQQHNDHNRHDNPRQILQNPPAGAVVRLLGGLCGIGPHSVRLGVRFGTV